MKISAIALLEGEEQNLAAPTTSTVASNNSYPLNPNANVFNLPLSASAKDEEVESTEEVHPFMNGDVGKLSCRGFSPLPVTTESHSYSQRMELEKVHLTDHCDSAGHSPVSCLLSISDMDNPTKDYEPELDVHESNSDANNGPELEIQTEPISDMTNLVSTSHIGVVQGQKEFTGNDDTGQLPVDNIPQDGSQYIEDQETDIQPVGADRKTLSREEIKLLISQQVEYFFSRENWSSDRYLLSQMDSDQYVPIYILANCSQFKSITKDHSIILDALKDSLYVQLDEEHNRVRPNYKRCIVILREIPESTPVKEVEAMFEGEGCPKALSCEFVHNESWYVTFESDSDAQNAYRYLRETVKTFCDKPILARIKTKPISRLGCLSVLPSYTGKPMVDQRDSPIPANGAALNPAPCVPPPVVGPSVPNPPPAPPSGAYAANNAQRVYFAQNNLNPSYNYNYTGSPQVPTAFFYPNPMVPWSGPNFYDINSFIQYNGLSPRATFKPPTATRYNNNVNNNRRNKSRDVKSEARLSNSGSNNIATSRHSAPGSHPPSSLSPHLANSHLGHQNVNSHHSYSSQPTVGDNSCSNPRSNSSGCSTPNHMNGNVTCVGPSYSQNDYQTNSQNDSFATYCPASNSKIESVNNTDSLVSSSSGGHASANSSEEANNNSISDLPSSADSTTMNCSVTTAAYSAPNASGDQSFPPSSQQSIMHPQIHHQQSLPQSHRNTYSNESHNIAGRETQPSRQMGYAENRNIGFAQKTGRYDSPLHSGGAMSRGGRRKLSRRDDDVNGHAGSNVNGRGPQRGSTQQNQETKSSLEARKPQFELQSNLFPPLPTAEEIIPTLPVVAPEEKLLEVTAQVAWSNDTHTFSDVMKGTAKPKLLNSEKEIVAQESVSLQPPTETRESKIGLASTAVPATTNHINNSNEDASVSASVIGTNTKPSVSLVTPDACSKNNNQSITASRLERAGQNRDHRAVREERRGAPLASARRDREYVSNIGRGGSRRENSNFSRQSGNKENRPQGRIWREDRPDSDGWITKTPRENRNNRDHRYQQHTHQQNSFENKSACPKHLSVMVNGDSSPPESPKLETESKPAVSALPTSSTNVKVDTNNSKNVCADKMTNDELMKEKESIAMNNNDGEHKTSWAKMALASKDKMERLSAELKEKEEQERIKKNRTTRPNSKVAERTALTGREKESKPFRRENFPSKEKERERDGTEKTREFRGADSRSTFRPPRESMRPKSPK